MQQVGHKMEPGPIGARPPDRTWCLEWWDWLEQGSQSQAHSACPSWCGVAGTLSPAEVWGVCCRLDIIEQQLQSPTEPILLYEWVWVSMPLSGVVLFLWPPHLSSCATRTNVKYRCCHHINWLSLHYSHMSFQQKNPYFSFAGMEECITNNLWWQYC